MARWCGDRQTARRMRQVSIDRRGARIARPGDRGPMARFSRFHLIALIAPALLVVTLLLVVPAINLLRFSFYDPGTTEITGEAGLANYAAVISDPYILRIIGKTLLISL